MLVRIAFLCLTMFAFVVPKPSYSLRGSAERSDGIPTDSIVSIGQVVTDVNGAKAFEPISTGTVIRNKTGQKFLLAARHTFSNDRTKYERERISVRFKTDENAPFTVALGVPLLLKTGETRTWKDLGGSIDLAMLEIPTDLQSRFPSGISISSFAEGKAIREGTQVVTIGFPSAANSNVLINREYLVKPVWRMGIIAWTNVGKLEDQFIIDSSIYSGNSGSPVFIVSNNQTSYAAGFKMIGVVSEGSQLETIACDRKLTMEGYGQLGYVEPITRVSRLLALFN